VDRVQVNFVVRAVQAETDCCFCFAAVEVVDEDGLYLLGHAYLRSCYLTVFNNTSYVIGTVEWVVIGGQWRRALNLNCTVPGEARSRERSARPAHLIARVKTVMDAPFLPGFDLGQGEQVAAANTRRIYAGRCWRRW